MKHVLYLRCQHPEDSAGEQITLCSGHVNVLRSKDASSLHSLEEALFHSLPRVELVLDEGKITSEQIHFIGFPLSPLSRGVTPRAVLQAHGIRPSKIEPTLTSMGLSLVADCAVAQLSVEDTRKLELAHALLGESRVALMRDPFSVLSARWREAFAKLVEQEAATGERIFIVSSLSERPECWLNSLHVARVDIDALRRATVGIDAELLARVRQEISSQVSNVVHLEVRKKHSTLKLSGAIAGTVASLSLVAVVIGTTFGGLSTVQYPPPTVHLQAVAPPLLAEPPPSEGALEVQQQPIAAAPSAPDTPLSDNSSLTPPQPDDLPPHTAPPVPQSPSPQIRAPRSDDLFESLQAYSQDDALTTDNDADDSTPVDSGDTASDWEKQREELRRRFLESIGSQ